MREGLRIISISISMCLVFFTSMAIAAKFTDSGMELVGLSQPSFSWGDYDLDGDLDLAVCGRSLNGPQTIIYRNDNGILVQDTTQNIIGISYGKVNWTDYDGDGDVDLTIAGYDSSVTPISKIYINVNGTLIVDPEQSLGIRYGAIDWADSDNDGKQDICVYAGHDSDWEPYTKIFKKKEDGSIEEIKQNLISIYYGAVAWGDYTGDGKLDLVITGWTSDGAVIKFYKDVNGTLIGDDTQQVEPVFHSSVAWGDYDLDRDLDLFIAGEGTNTVITKVYRNDNGILIEDTSQQLPAVSFSALSLCDYDRDMDLDLVLAGTLPDRTPITKLFINNAAIPLPIHHRIEVLLEGKILKNGTFSTDDTLNLSAKAYDEKNDHPIRDVEVYWQLDKPIGNIIIQKGKGISLDLTKVGTATLIAYDRQGRTATVMLDVKVGRLASLRIEREIEGIPVGTLTVTPDMDLLLYARGYDSNNNLRGEEIVNWSVIGDIGTLSTITGTSVIFKPEKVGVGKIKIENEMGHWYLSEPITVKPGIIHMLKIEDTKGKEVSNLTVTADEDVYYLYAMGYDRVGNPIGPVEVEWSIIGDKIGILSTSKGTMTIFDPTMPGKGSIKIVDLSTSQLTTSTGLITVIVGKPHHLIIVDKDNKPINDITLTADDTLELFAKTFDKQGNEISLIEVDWKLIGDIGNLSTSRGTSVILDLVKVGTGTILAESYLSDTTGIITVLHGNLHHFVFNKIEDQIVELPFKITVTAKDADGNTVTSYNGTSNIFLDTTGTLDSKKQANFIEGVLNDYQVVILKACGSVTISTSNAENIKGESNKFAVLGGSIVGNIANETGKRLANILIEAYLKLENGSFTLKGSTTTLADGSYLITGLPPGTYEVRVIPPKGYQAPEPQIVKIDVILTKDRTLAMAPQLVNFVLLEAPANTIVNAYVYPNPCIVTQHNRVTFKNLTSNVTIKIFTITGELVKTLESRGTNSIINWNLKNEKGDIVASGIYIYLIRDNISGEKKTGKLGVIR